MFYILHEHRTSMSHADARLTPAGRLLVIQRIEAGMPQARVAHQIGLSWGTVARGWHASASSKRPGWRTAAQAQRPLRPTSPTHLLMH